VALPEWTRNSNLPIQPWGAGVGHPPDWYGPVIPPERLPAVLSRTYEGTANSIRQLREADAEALAARGYYPTSEVWIAQGRGRIAWLIAVLLVVVLLVGLLVIACYLANPTGALTVTYTRRVVTATTAAVPSQSPAATGYPAPGASAEEVQTSLDALEQLRSGGAITDQEYTAKRRDVLNRL